MSEEEQKHAARAELARLSPEAKAEISFIIAESLDRSAAIAVGLVLNPILNAEVAAIPAPPEAAPVPTPEAAAPAPEEPVPSEAPKADAPAPPEEVSEPAPQSPE